MDYNRSPVEVNVSDRCEHDCFVIYLGSPSVWRISGLPPQTAEPDMTYCFHRHLEEDPCDCFDGDDEDPGTEGRSIT